MCKICLSKYTSHTDILNIHCCNKVNSIPILENNTLTELTIYKNKKIKTLVDNLYELKKIKLYLCNIIEIPFTFKNLIEIIIIDVPDLNTLPKSCIHLKRISLKETNVKIIPYEYQKLESLELHTVPVCEIYDYPILNKLCLFKTKVTKLNPNLVNLKELNISKEFIIDKLPDTYINLEKLYCSITRITKLPNSYTKLKLLFIHKSPISIIPKEYSSVELLDCTSSFVKLIPKELVKLKQLSYDEDKTTWDDSWYVEAEDRPKIVNIQRFYRLYLLYKNSKRYIQFVYRYLLYKKNKYIDRICSFLYKCTMRYRLNKNNTVLVIYRLQEPNYHFHCKPFKDLHTIYRYVSKLTNVYMYKIKYDTEKKQIRAIFINNNYIVKYNTIYEHDYNKIISTLLTNNIIYSNVVLDKQKNILRTIPTNQRKHYLENYN